LDLANGFDILCWENNFKVGREKVDLSDDNYSSDRHDRYRFISRGKMNLKKEAD